MKFKIHDGHFMDNVVLIDSFAHIYRGFYALPPLRNSLGTPTNAIFAFARMLLFVERDFPSSHGAAVFDKGRSLERLKLAPDYKATRPPTPPDLLRQIPYAKSIAEAFGWQLVEEDNCEADDIISAFCAKFANLDIRIVSNDKDFAQLVNRRVLMLVSGKDGGFNAMGADSVFAKFAVRPEQIVDYLSLVGDSSDNIHGAPGVGAKTAAKLLAEFSTLENLLGKISFVKSEKIRASLAESAGRLKKNKVLITLSGTNPFTDAHELPDFARKKPDYPRIECLCEELELRSILAEIRKKIGASKKDAKEWPETHVPELF